MVPKETVEAKDLMMKPRKKTASLKDLTVTKAEQIMIIQRNGVKTRSMMIKKNRSKHGATLKPRKSKKKGGVMLKPRMRTQKMKPRKVIIKIVIKERNIMIENVKERTIIARMVNSTTKSLAIKSHTGSVMKRATKVKKRLPA